MDKEPTNTQKLATANKPVSYNLISIDILRALAALGVFYYHQHMGTMLTRYTGAGFFAYTDVFGATYAVPLFFLISGYCIHLSNIKYLKTGQPLPLKKYYKRRLLRIYPAYLLAVFFSVLVNLICVPDYQFNPADFFTHVFLLQGFSIAYFNTINVVLWTITIEMAFYLIYPFFYFLRAKFSLHHAILFALLISVISISYFSIQGNMPAPHYYFLFNLWFAWCCGAYLADKKAWHENDLNHPGYKVFYALILSAFILLKFQHNPKLAIVEYQINILIWTAPLMFLISKESWLVHNQTHFLKLIRAIGLSSYSLYLFHEPLIYLKNYLVHQYLPQNFHFTAIVLGIFLIPYITWLSYQYVEKAFIEKKNHS